MTYDTRSPAKKLVGRVLMLVSLAGLAVAGFGVFTLVSGTEVDGSRIELPGRAVVELEAGEYELWAKGIPTSSRGCDQAAIADSTALARPRLIARADRKPAELVRKGSCTTGSPEGGNRAVTAMSFTVATTGAHEFSGRRSSKPFPPSSLYLTTADSAASPVLILIAGLLVAFVALFVKLAKF